MHIAGFSGMIEVPMSSSTSQLLGSVRYDVNGGNVYEKSRSASFIKLKKKPCSVPDASSESSPRFLRLNKSKFGKKFNAYSYLTASKRFMAFYSISFPLGTADKVASSLLNIWLTRVRLERPGFTYLWVAERQKNGTIHYHLVTNSFLSIKVVNRFMAVAIHTKVYGGKCQWGNSSLAKYQGVDVRTVYDRKGVKHYLKKYVSKNHEAWEGVRPCGMSAEVSALFTGVNLSEASDNVIPWWGLCPFYDAQGRARTYTTEQFTFRAWAGEPPDVFIELITRYNDNVMYQFSAN